MTTHHDGKAVRSKRDRRRDGAGPVTRAEFDAVAETLRERNAVIEELRRELAATCRELADGVRRELQTQFTRIAQIQQEIDDLKRRVHG